MWRLVPLVLLMLPTSAAAKPGCAWLVRHVPDADVAFKPGVDVRGRPVTPADLSPPPPILRGERVRIELSLPVSLFRHGRARRVDEADVLLGELEVDLGTGAVWLDGEPLDGTDTGALIAYCRDRLGLPPLPAHKPAPK